MEPDLFRFDDRHGFERKKTNFFAWTIAILLLSGVAMAAWLGSFYIIGQPERPESYRILQKLHKIDPPKRFQLTAAPPGEFLNPKQLFARYQAMGPAELARQDAVLTRNFIRNFQQVHGLVTYVVGRFNVVEARELTQHDVFTSGAVALARAVDQPELLMEHVFTTADDHDAKLLQERLVMGMDVNFERSHDLSAVIHVERLPDGQVQITAIPLLYGSYAVTRGTGTFSLEPPADLNLAAGWPLFKSEMRRAAEIRYDSYRSRLAPASSSLPLLGLPAAKTAPPVEDALVRVEPAVRLDAEPAPPPPPLLRTGRNKSLAKVGPKGSPSSQQVASASQPTIRRAQAVTDDAGTAPNEPSAPTPTVRRALPVTSSSPAVALASTAGATWKTFAPGQAPSTRASGLKGDSPCAIAKPRFGAPPLTTALPSRPISVVESLSTLPSASATPSTPRTVARTLSGNAGAVAPLPSERSNAAFPVTTALEPSRTSVKIVSKAESIESVRT